MSEKIVIFTDGGSRGNPGPAGIGVWIETLDKKYGECIGETTNNVAEYSALIYGLKKLKQLLGKDKTKQYEIECNLDSELIVKQMNHEYKIKDENVQKNFIEIWNLMLDFKNVIFKHIPREKNSIADALVNEALNIQGKQKSLL
ncbi:MAG: ribonuclease HI family protein [Candidatus Moraniibacteriota bacterium]